MAEVAVDVCLPVVIGFDVEAGEPAAAADVGVDVDGVAQIEGEVGGFLGGVAADHNFAGLVREWSAEFFVDEGEGVLL